MLPDNAHLRCCAAGRGARSMLGRMRTPALSETTRGKCGPGIRALLGSLEEPKVGI